MIGGGIKNRGDPLQVLRSFYANNKKAKLHGSTLVFDKYFQFDIKSETAWQSPQTNNQYNLGSLWLFLQHKRGNINDYYEKVTELSLKMISIPDRQEIEKYFLQGSIKETNHINQQLKVTLAQKNFKKQFNNSGRESMQIEGGKRVKAEEITDPELQVMDYLSKFQKPVMTKTRQLRYPEKSFENIIKSLFASHQKGKMAEQNTAKTLLTSILQKKKSPIIIVPENSRVGNVALNNIQKLLVKGEYDQKEPPLQSHIRKITFDYQIRNKRVTFQVTNNPSLMATNDWNNVVAIFVQGRKSQFQNWPVRDPVQLFKRAKGFLVKYKNSKTDDANDWNVRTLILEKFIRFRDNDIKNYIWNQIESHLFSSV